MKIRVIQHGDKEFEADDEFAAPAIAAAISGESGEDVRSEIIDYTDTERSDVDRDEYVTVTGDDGSVLWQGWLDSDSGDVPPPAGRDALEQAAAPLTGRGLVEVLRETGADMPGIAFGLAWDDMPGHIREFWDRAASRIGGAQ